MNKKFCFIGHVDVGKSTLAGHLYVQTGNMSDHELNKLQNECKNQKYQLWSRIFDIWEEEREKGKTHEFSVMPFKFQNKTYEMIDTPGHKTFIRALIAGISHFNPDEIVGCLLISASKGEFESGWGKGQTREDITLVRCIGIKHLIVVINKMDSVNWDKEIYDDIINKITPFIKQCNFESVHYLPISGYKGINLININGTPEWYSGKSFIDTLDSIVLQTTTEELIKLSEWTHMLCNIKILWTSNLITCGYNCILHYGNAEYDIRIEKIEKKVFLKNKDIAKVLITSDKPIIRCNTRNIILRCSTNTVGFGKIIKVK